MSLFTRRFLHLDIARADGLSRERVRQVVAAAMQRLRAVAQVAA